VLTGFKGATLLTLMVIFHIFFFGLNTLLTYSFSLLLILSSPIQTTLVKTKIIALSLQQPMF